MRALLLLALFCSACGVEEDTALYGSGDDVPPSIFTRPKRSTQRSVADSYDEIRVTSEQQLRNAIGTLAARGAGSDLASLGGGIVIVSPLTISSPIIIPEECAGITIRSIAKVPVTAATPALSALFDVRAEFVSIKDMFVYGTPEGYFDTFVLVTGSPIVGRSAKWLSVTDNIAFVNRLYVDDTADEAPAATIHNNKQVAADIGHPSASIVIGSIAVSIVDNSIEGGSAGDVDQILFNVNGGYSTIRGNYLDERNINTSLGLGHNAIVGNYALKVVPIVTVDVTDEQAGNCAA